MKKIKLLVVLAILVVGIQGCSTEKEEVLTEQKSNNLPEGVISVDELFNLADNFGKQSLNKNLQPGNTSCYTRLIVVFKPNLNQSYSEFVTEQRNDRFSSIYTNTSPTDCKGKKIYEWFVPCNEVPDPICDTRCIPFSRFEGGSKVLENGASVETEEEDDDANCELCVYGFTFIPDNSDPDCVEILKYLRL